RQRPGRSRPRLRPREVPVGAAPILVRWSSLLLPCPWHASERRARDMAPSTPDQQLCYLTECRTHTALEPRMPLRCRSVLHATRTPANIAARHVHDYVGRYAKELLCFPLLHPGPHGLRCCSGGPDGATACQLVRSRHTGPSGKRSPGAATCGPPAGRGVA